MTKVRKMLVTAALPYANGPLHLGHLLEHIQLDIWVRTHKMLGHTCISVCGDDAHGTPIMLKAERLGISPETLITGMQQSHEQDFAAFAVDYDCYHNTHSEENRFLVAQIYESLRAAGDIVKKKICQAYDPVREMFLPDRYIKGTCPKCGAEEQYGDNCEVCGATYAATELVNPTSVVSGSKPIEKESEHYFFDLPRYEQFLKAWAKKGHLQVEVANKLEEWFETGLRQWDITRDSPYFGFLIPGTEDKYFYVWLDAPIGYMASFKKFCKEHQLSFAEFWDKNSSAELYHFVGKDIIYFHALFWPAVLEGSGHRLPNSIFAHGFLTVNGQKMSKSRGTYIEARQYLKHLHPEYLRYYYAAKSNGSIEDLDLNLADFINRVNADLIGKVINIASRCAGFISKHFNSQLASKHRDPDLFAAVVAKREEVIAAYVQRDSAQAIRLIMACADKINQFIDTQKPWQAIKDDARFTEVHEVCTQGLNLFRLLLGYLKPILPLMSAAGEQFLNCPPLTWESLDKPLFNQPINPFRPLMQRVEKESVEALTTLGSPSLSKN